MTPMTVEEYKKRLEIIQKEFDDKKSVLGREFALSHNSYKIDDTISDHSSSLIIKKILFSSSIHDSNKPYQCVYYGLLLNKNGTFKKIKGKDEIAKGYIYQSNIKLITNV